MGLRHTTETFVNKSRQLHGDKYNYELVDYKNNKTKVKIVCHTHGVFEQTPNSHLNGRGCLYCSIDNQKMGVDAFISKSIQVHGNKYDYSQVEYVNTETKVKIICPIHGKFYQEPYSHIRGCGCKFCFIDDVRGTDITFISKSIQVHGNKYDYSQVEYTNSHIKVKIICPIHGVFEQLPYSHIQGAGCSACGGVKKSNTNDFISKSIQVHGNKYDYSQVEYVTAHDKVVIICYNHGQFEQTPHAHLRGDGCGSCFYMGRSSNQEIEFAEYIKSLYDGEIITNTRKVIPPYEIDVYLPDRQLAFEYNGDYWHQEGVNKPLGYHQMKNDMCMSVGVKLHHIWESDWVMKNDSVKKHILGLVDFVE